MTSAFKTMARHPNGGGRSPRPGRPGRGRGAGRGGRHCHPKYDTAPPGGDHYRGSDTAGPGPHGHQCGGGGAGTRGGADAESLLEAVSTLAGQVRGAKNAEVACLAFSCCCWIQAGGGPSLSLLRIVRIFTGRRRDLPTVTPLPCISIVLNLSVRSSKQCCLPHFILYIQ